MFSTCAIVWPPVCSLLLPTCQRYFENEWTNFDANWHKCFLRGKGMNLGAKRSKVKVTGGLNYTWKPEGDTILDPLNRVNKSILRAAELLPLKKGGGRGGVLHIVLTAPPPYGGYASCWRTCFSYLSEDSYLSGGATDRCKILHGGRATFPTCVLSFSWRYLKRPPNMEPRKGLGWTIWGLSLQLLDGLRQTHTICESNAASEKTVLKMYGMGQ